MAQKINVNTTPNQFMPTLYYSQGDIGRTLEIALVSSDGYEIPSGATVEMVATKPSGFGFTVSGTLTGNVASFVTTETMTAEWGRFPAEIKITNGTDVIGTANFYLNGEINPHPENTIDGDAATIISQLTLLVERVETAASSVLDRQTVTTTLPAGTQATYSFDEGTNTQTFGIPQGEAGAGAVDVTASAYSSSKAYAVGDYVIHNSNLYRCTTAITTAESFTAGHWTQVVLADDVTDLKSEINDLPFEIYNANEVKDDYYLNSSGNEIPQVGWSVTNYLKINESAVYYIKTETTSSAVFCWFYDKNKSQISSFQTSESGTHTLTAPSGAEYVRFSIMTSETSDFTYTSQLLLPYKKSVILPTFIKQATLKSSFEDDVYVGFYYGVTGVVNQSSNWAMLPLYRVEKGDVFYMNYPFSQYLTCFDENKQFVSNQIASSNDPITYIIPSGVSFIGVNLLKASLGTYVITLNGLPLGGKYDLSWLDDTNHVWANKSYISHGDSITWQDGEEYIQGEHIGEVAKGYQTIFAENVGLGRKVNWGKSGWSMAVVNGNGVVNTIIQLAYYSQFDLCTIACGTNDFKLNVPLGSLGVIGDTTFDDTTFYGAYRKSVEYILSNSPTIRLVLMTPLQRDNSGYDVNYTNSAGHKLIDYVNAVKAVGQMYGLPVCDMYANSGFTKKTLATYTMDGLHPNDVGYKRMGDYLTGFLNAVGN